MASSLKTSFRAISSTRLAVPRYATRCFCSTPELRNATASGSVDIRGKLREALKAAMKGRQKDVTGCIKAIMADITYHEKAGANPNEPASEDSVIEVIRKGINQRSQATQSYPPDHPNHTALQSEITFLSSFLPVTLSPESITSTLQKIIDGLSPDERSSKGVTGTVLKQFWEEVKKGDVADKKSLGKMISELLSPTASASSSTSKSTGTRQMSTMASSRRCMSTSSTSSSPSSVLPKPRLDYKKLTSNPSTTFQNARRRNSPLSEEDIAHVGRVYKQTLELGKRYDSKRAEQKKAGGKMREGSEGVERAKALKLEVQGIEEELREAEDSLLEHALVIPNDTHPSCPLGPEENAVELERFGPPRLESDTRRDHQSIATKYEWLDLPATALVSGTSWSYLKGFLAMLELAVTNYSMSVAVKRGWTPVMTPDVVKEDVMTRCGFQPRDGAGQTYFVSTTPTSQRVSADTTQLCLAATAEIPLAGLSANKILPTSALPIRYVGLGRAFRAEAGARGADTRGLYRVHQFSKVELFAVTAQEGSEEMMEEIREVQKEIFAGLGLSVRLLDMPSEELGASAYRKYDMEAWMPGRGKWGEISSTSNCTDYQSRRLNIRYRGQEGLEFAHTLNGTCAAVPRLLVALVENGVELGKGQGEERVRLPGVLRPFWVGGEEIGTRKDPLALRWV